MSGSKKRAVFLDRDGTLIRDVDYLTDPSELRLLPGAADALRRLREAGYLLLVATNQSAVARGWLTEETLARIHAKLSLMLRERGAEPDAFYYCPHLPGGQIPEYSQQCLCRKPRPGMLQKAAREWNVQMDESWAVGDSVRDVEAGRRAGCRTILLGADSSKTGGDFVAKDLAAATNIILRCSEEARS